MSEGNVELVRRAAEAALRTVARRDRAEILSLHDSVDAAGLSGQ